MIFLTLLQFLVHIGRGEVLCRNRCKIALFNTNFVFLSNFISLMPTGHVKIKWLPK